jgi:hypothetical protein
MSRLVPKWAVEIPTFVLIVVGIFVYIGSTFVVESAKQQELEAGQERDEAMNAATAASLPPTTRAEREFHDELRRQIIEQVKAEGSDADVQSADDRAEGPN